MGRGAKRANSQCVMMMIVHVQKHVAQDLVRVYQMVDVGPRVPLACKALTTLCGLWHQSNVSRTHDTVLSHHSGARGLYQRGRQSVLVPKRKPNDTCGRHYVRSYHIADHAACAARRTCQCAPSTNEDVTPLFSRVARPEKAQRVWHEYNVTST